MERYVQREVASIRDDPSDEFVDLLVGTDGANAAVQEVVRDLDGTVVEDLPFDTLHVELPERSVERLCLDNRVVSVELTESLELLSGN